MIILPRCSSNEKQELVFFRICAQTVGSIIILSLSSASQMVLSTSVNEEYRAVTHRSSSYMKLRVPS